MPEYIIAVCLMVMILRAATAYMYTYMDLCRVCVLFFVLWRWYLDRPAMKSICSVSICVFVCLSNSSRVSRLSRCCAA